MRTQCPSCGGDLVGVVCEGSMDYRPCGYTKIVCEDCGKVFATPDYPPSDIRIVRDDEGQEGGEK